LTVGFGLIFEGNKRGPGNLRGSTWLATLSVGLGIYLFLLLRKKEKKEGTKCNQGSLLPFLGNLYPFLGVGSGCTQFSTLG